MSSTYNDRGILILSDDNLAPHTVKLVGNNGESVTITNCGPTEDVLKQGAKFDTGKPMMDLLSSASMTEIAKVLTFGAKKYAAHNWRKGIAYSRVYSALQRHLTAWNEGENTDPESGLPHLAHAGCCLMFLLEYTSKQEKYAKFDDRYTGEDS